MKKTLSCIIFSACGVISGSRLMFGAADFKKNASKCKFYLVHGKLD